MDVRSAGEGQLEIMVNEGAVPNTVRGVGSPPGVYRVSFMPLQAGPHVVSVCFNGEPLSCESLPPSFAPFMPPPLSLEYLQFPVLTSV